MTAQCSNGIVFTIIYFSPTGNALHLAKLLAQHLGMRENELIPLEFIEPDQLTSNKRLILIYPIHGFNAPRIVKRFVKRLPPKLFDEVSLIGVGCTTNWLNNAASSDLRKMFSAKGYPIILDNILAMPLTFVLAFPDAVARKLIAESEIKIIDIGTSLIEGCTETIVKVNYKSQLLNFIGKVEQFASRLFGLELHANKNCNSCGICWNNCPGNNIKCSINGMPKFGFNCLMCMRCIYNCPQKAIAPRFSKFLPVKNGYSITQYLK